MCGSHHFCKKQCVSCVRRLRFSKHTSVLAKHSAESQCAIFKDPRSISFSTLLPSGILFNGILSSGSLSGIQQYNGRTDRQTELRYSMCQQRTTHAARAKTVVGIMTVWLITTVTSTISGELATFVRLVVTRSLLCQHIHHLISVRYNNFQNE